MASLLGDPVIPPEIIKTIAPRLAYRDDRLFTFILYAEM
jgi:hypothetical protein